MKKFTSITGLVVALALGGSGRAVPAEETPPPENSEESVHHIYIHLKQGAYDQVGRINVELKDGKAVAVKLVEAEETEAPAAPPPTGEPPVAEEPPAAADMQVEPAPAAAGEAVAEEPPAAPGLITTPPLEEGDTGSDEAVAPAPPGGAPGEHSMGLLLFIFVLAIFLGFELISKVPSQLHTPLMSGSNAISGITIVGALLAVGLGEGRLMVLLGFLAVVFASINVVGGYMVTDRMLGMFKQKD
jgi:NAD(P) transhydrogenase subunit alpha